MKWRLGDLVDLEYFLYRDADALSAGDSDRDRLRERDRDIFLNFVAPALPATETDASPDRQFIIKTWLNRRREAAESKKYQDTAPPGEAFDSLQGSLRGIFLVIGLLFGGVAGISFLTYTGDSPVNVFVYFVVFVASQLLLLLLLLVVSLYRSATKSFPSSPLYTFIGRLMYKILLVARGGLGSNLTVDQRLRAGAAFGTITGKARAYGALILFPILILTQLFALGFNLGLLGSTLLKVVTADIAFGWQSTIQLSPSAVHDLAQTIALPWSWAVPADMALPTLAQVEGSRIILKDGIYHLFTPDLVSWWPFLCFAVLVYGLLPRAFLFLGALVAMRRSLDSLDFRQSAHEQLLARMTTPLVTTSGESLEKREAAPAPKFRPAELQPESRSEPEPETKSKPAPEAELESAPEPEPAPAATGEVEAQPQPQIQISKIVVMIPDELHDSCSPEEIASVVSQRGPYGIAEIIRVDQDYETDRELLANLSSRDQTTQPDILLIQEAWQPPIMESVDFIKQLRAAVGASPRIDIGLIGKPRPATIFTPATPDNLRVWQRTIAALGDPFISTEGLVKNES